MSTDTGAGVDLRATLARGSRVARARRVAGCELLEVAADWAAGRPGDGLCSQHTRLEMASERAMVIAGDGTPTVAEAAPAELGLEIAMNPWQAARLIADALDLQFRLPRTWKLVQEHRVECERARRLALRTRMLTPAQADQVDAEIAVLIMTVTWTRLEKKIDAAILTADPEGARERAENAARWRGARLSRETEDGLVELLLRMDADDGTGLYAMCDYMADLLIKHREHLPEDVSDRGAQTKDEWMAVAAGVLRNPFLGARLLLEFGEPDLFQAMVDSFDSFDTSASSATSGHQPTAGADDPGHDGAESGAAGSSPGAHDAGEDAHPLDMARGADDRLRPTGAGRDREQPTAFGPCDDDRGCGDHGVGDHATDDDGADQRARPDRTAGDHGTDQPARPDRTAREDGTGEHRTDDHVRVDRAAMDGETDNRTAEERRTAAQDAAVRAFIRAMDPQRLLPRVQLNIHLSEDALRGDHPVARVEELGPQLVTTVRAWLQSGVRIDLRPIIDPAGIVAVDSYETPRRMRLALLARSPASIFPYSGSLHGTMEIDHTIPYRPPPAGPPGQTGLHGLGPMATREHRAKTFGRIGVRQPEPGCFVWHTQTGRVIITNPAGTLDLGTGRLARTLWQACIPPSPVETLVHNLVRKQPIRGSG